LIALDRDRMIVGAAGILREPWVRTAHDAFCNVVVLQTWSGCGVGRALAEQIELWAADQGLKRLTTGFQANNLRGRRFAEARGFRHEVTRRRYARIGQHGVDRIQMGRLA
jgi:GNAT superfamily N-acetyltransferase